MNSCRLISLFIMVLAAFQVEAKALDGRILDMSVGNNSCSQVISNSLTEFPNFIAISIGSKSGIIGNVEVGTPIFRKIFSGRLLIGRKLSSQRSLYRSLNRRQVRIGSLRCSSVSSIWVGPQLDKIGRQDKLLFTTNIDCGYYHCTIHHTGMIDYSVQ